MQEDLSNEINALTAIGAEMDCSVEKSLLLRISKLSVKLGRALKTLEQLTDKSDDFSTSQAEADYYKDKMIPAEFPRVALTTFGASMVSLA